MFYLTLKYLHGISAHIWNLQKNLQNLATVLQPAAKVIFLFRSQLSFFVSSWCVVLISMLYNA